MFSSLDQEMDPEASRTMEMAALGRPFNLGMLYDCRQDSLVPGNGSHNDILNHRRTMNISESESGWD